MKQETYAKITRASKVARTNFGRVAQLLANAADEPNVHVRAVMSYESYDLLHTVLGNAGMLIPLFDIEQTQELESLASALASDLRRHRVALKLENVTGRTPEETAAFLDKARKMREDQ